MHRFTARNLEVLAVTEQSPFIRVTVSGDDLDDWASVGPGDHAKIFFPDPETREIVAPTPVGPGESGIVRPEAPMIARDFTPLNVRTDTATGRRVFDLDFLQHDNSGPASDWARHVRLGDPLVMVGPRGSVTAAVNAPRLVLAVDASALPAASRWIADMPSSTEVHVVFDALGDDHAAHAAETYLSGQTGRAVTVTAATAAADGFASAVRSVGIDEHTYVFAAGEASRLVPLRRMLKGELELPRAQYAVSGYWKQGTVAFDHHAPIDPEDPED